MGSQHSAVSADVACCQAVQRSAPEGGKPDKEKVSTQTGCMLPLKREEGWDGLRAWLDVILHHTVGVIAMPQVFIAMLEGNAKTKGRAVSQLPIAPTISIVLTVTKSSGA